MMCAMEKFKKFGIKVCLCISIIFLFNSYSFASDGDSIDIQLDKFLLDSIRFANNKPLTVKGDVNKYRPKFVNGAMTQTLGLAMNGGGVLLAFYGVGSKSAVFEWIGLATALAGIPVNGAGAKMMTKSVNMIYQDSIVQVPSWGLYEGSWGAIFIGGIGLLSTAGAQSGNESDDESLGGITSAGLLILGIAGQVISWYDFTHKGMLARDAYNGISVSLAPLLIPSEQGNMNSGIQVQVKF